VEDFINKAPVLEMLLKANKKLSVAWREVETEGLVQALCLRNEPSIVGCIGDKVTLEQILDFASFIGGMLINENKRVFRFGD
jgi:hypothetical protein